MEREDIDWVEGILEDHKIEVIKWAIEKKPYHEVSQMACRFNCDTHPLLLARTIYHHYKSEGRKNV